MGQRWGEEGKGKFRCKWGKLRNGAVEFAGMTVSLNDLDALVAFLKSLTEDYDDA